MKNRQIAFLNDTKRQSIKPIDYLDIGNGVFVIPYSFISGAVNLSEKGIETETSVITEPHSFLQYVFTGKDAINVVWDNSTYFTPNTTNTNYLDYNFQVGDYFYGKPITGQVEGGAEISPVEGNDDFLAMKTSQSITLQFEYEQPITGAFYEGSVFYHHLVPNDLYKRKLYRIPQLGENKWFYISNSQPVFQDETGKMIGCIVTFETVLDKLQTSGRAVEQYIQNGAPGEPRAVPVINYNWDTSGVTSAYLSLDENEKTLKQDKLIRYVQTELQGAGGFCGCMVYGRRLTETDGVITTQPWEMLLPHEFYQFNSNPLNKTSVPSSTYCFLPNYKLSMNVTSDMIESWKKVQDSLSTCQCAGKIYLGVKGDWDGTYPTGTHKSNASSLPYWDPAWLPMSSLSARTNIDMLGSPYTSATASFLTTDTFNSLFIKNSLVCMNNPQLPVEINFAKPYHLSNIPIIGKMLSPWIGDRTLFPNKTNIPQTGIGMFIDKSYLSQIIQLTPTTSGSSDAYGFLSSLGGDMIPKGFGATSYNTSMCWKLTDLLGDGKQTILLGQRKNADGSYIKSDKTPYTLDLTNVVTTSESSTGYVIDRIVLFSEFSGNVRFSLYNSSMKPQYATTIVSSTKFLDNSYNNYMTMVNFGTWPSEYISDNYNPTWPENYGNIIPINASLTQFDNWSAHSVGTSTQRPIVPLPGTWNWTWTREETTGSAPVEKHRYGNKFTKTSTPIVQTINYDELGLSGVTDRDTFITACKEIRLDWEGTLLNTTLSDWNVGWKWEKKVNEYLGVYDYSTVTLTAGTYEYDNDYYLINVNGTQGFKSAEWDNQYLAFNMSSNETVFQSDSYLHTIRFCQKVNVKIELLTTYIQITITENSYIEQAANLDTDFLIHLNSSIQDTYGWTPLYYTGDNRWINNLNSKIQLKYLDLIER